MRTFELRQVLLDDSLADSTVWVLLRKSTSSSNQRLVPDAGQRSKLRERLLAGVCHLSVLRIRGAILHRNGPLQAISICWPHLTRSDAERSIVWRPFTKGNSI